MNETISWTLAGTVASLALLSLGATGLQQREAPQPPAPRAAFVVTDVAPSSAVLAEAYFRVAREAPGLDSVSDDWFVRHEITVKGLAAQRGENPAPEAPESHALKPADMSEFNRAGRLVQNWRARLEANGSRPAAVVSLAADLQVHYDWWLLLAEAGAPQMTVETAHRLYEETRARLAAESRIAAL
jgi:hypothetical protein